MVDDPLTPLKVAVIVTEEPLPMAVILPRGEVLTLTAHPLELFHTAELVTSEGEPLLKLAWAVSCCDCPWVSETVLGETVTAVGELTKNPLHPTANASNKSIVKAVASGSFGWRLDIMKDPSGRGFRRYTVVRINCSRGNFLSPFDSGTVVHRQLADKIAVKHEYFLNNLL